MARFVYQGSTHDVGGHAPAPGGRIRLKVPLSTGGFDTLHITCLSSEPFEVHDPRAIYHVASLHDLHGQPLYRRLKD